MDKENDKTNVTIFLLKQNQSNICNKDKVLYLQARTNKDGEYYFVIINSHGELYGYDENGCFNEKYFINNKINFTCSFNIKDLDLIINHHLTSYEKFRKVLEMTSTFSYIEAYNKVLKEEKEYIKEAYYIKQQEVELIFKMNPTPFIDRKIINSYYDNYFMLGTNILHDKKTQNSNRDLDDLYECVDAAKLGKWEVSHSNDYLVFNTNNIIIKYNTSGINSK